MVTALDTKPGMLVLAKVLHCPLRQDTLFLLLTTSPRSGILIGASEFMLGGGAERVEIVTCPFMLQTSGYQLLPGGPHG